MIIGKGKAFECLVKNILLGVGFNEVMSDPFYVFDGSAGQMINGLGEAHNADVLLEPPVQTPFFATTRLLVECKNYNRRVGLDVVRGVLGLREDINSFDILDYEELKRRKNQNRKNRVCYSRYAYSVAIASAKGFTDQAQNMAATYRIPLIEFNKYPFWSDWIRELPSFEDEPNCYDEKRIKEFVLDYCKGMAVGITNTGQLLFLLNQAKRVAFSNDEYDIHWEVIDEPWTLECGEEKYLFALPYTITEQWLKEGAGINETIDYKSHNVSRMVVYFRNHGCPDLKMLSIKKDRLKKLAESHDVAEKEKWK